MGAPQQPHRGRGDAVLLSFAAADRDPARFADPERFDPERLDPERDVRGHPGFGWEAPPDRPNPRAAPRATSPAR